MEEEGGTGLWEMGTEDEEEETVDEGGTVEATAETEEKEDECRLESPSTFGC